MDVNMIQKVSNLAEELLAHGMVESKDDAYQKAEKMLSKDGSTEIAGMKGTVGGVRFESNNPEEEKIPSADAGEKKDIPASLDIEELKEAMSKNTSFIVKKFKELDETITGLRDEIDLLKSSFAAGGAQKRLSDGPKEEAVKRNHPRQGDYKEEDVAVDKIFYYGNR